MRNKFYFHTDHLGSTRVISDTARNVMQTISYYPFGNLLTYSGFNTEYKFTGKELDVEAEFNLYYYGARYYDPAIGRFISIDPILSYTNPYSYVMNNPLKYIDPNGMIPRHHVTEAEKRDLMEAMRPKYRHDPTGFIHDLNLTEWEWTWYLQGKGVSEAEWMAEFGEQENKYGVALTPQQFLAIYEKVDAKFSRESKRYASTDKTPTDYWKVKIDLRGVKAFLYSYGIRQAQFLRSAEGRYTLDYFAGKSTSPRVKVVTNPYVLLGLSVIATVLPDILPDEFYWDLGPPWPKEEVERQWLLWPGPY